MYHMLILVLTCAGESDSYHEAVRYSSIDRWLTNYIENIDKLDTFYRSVMSEYSLSLLRCMLAPFEVRTSACS